MLLAWVWCSSRPITTSGAACTAITTEKAIVAEDKTGLSLLKMAGAEDGQLYIQGHTQSRLPFDTVHVFLGAIGPLTHPEPKARAGDRLGHGRHALRRRPASRRPTGCA